MHIDEVLFLIPAEGAGGDGLAPRRGGARRGTVGVLLVILAPSGPLPSTGSVPSLAMRGAGRRSTQHPVQGASHPHLCRAAAARGRPEWSPALWKQIVLRMALGRFSLRCDGVMEVLKWRLRLFGLRQIENGWAVSL